MYRNNVEESAKEQIRTDVEMQHEDCRCRIIEGAKNGFFIETFNRNLAPPVPLADHLNCTIKGVLNRIEDGWILIPKK